MYFFQFSIAAILYILLQTLRILLVYSPLVPLRCEIGLVDPQICEDFPSKYDLFVRI